MADTMTAESATTTDQGLGGDIATPELAEPTTAEGTQAAPDATAEPVKPAEPSKLETKLEGWQVRQQVQQMLGPIQDSLGEMRDQMTRLIESRTEAGKGPTDGQKQVKDELAAIEAELETLETEPIDGRGLKVLAKLMDKRLEPLAQRLENISKRSEIQDNLTRQEQEAARIWSDFDRQNPDIAPVRESLIKQAYSDTVKLCEDNGIELDEAGFAKAANKRFGSLMSEHRAKPATTAATPKPSPVKPPAKTPPQSTAGTSITKGASAARPPLSDGWIPDDAPPPSLARG